MLSKVFSSALVFLAVSFTSAAPPKQPAKRIVNGNLTPDGYYHNRYHALLSMAVYGDYNTLCPNNTFTEAAKLKNFPNSTRPAWDVLGTFGPTPSGCEGFYAIVPEMNKAVIIFKGNYELEQQLPLDVVDWEGIGMRDVCNNCTANAFAMQGYLECKNETNNWKTIVDAYSGQGLVFSITGHGLGGMHSLIASVDLNYQQIDYYSHNYGTPRTFNVHGSNWYNQNFNGEAGERGVYGNDTYTEFIPASENYTHTGTTFLYTGFDGQTLGPIMSICWDGNDPLGPIVDDPGCYPQPQPNSTSLQDHYYYFTEVGTCGGPYKPENTTIIDNFLASPAALWNAATVSSSLPPQTPTSTSSSTSGGTSQTAGGISTTSAPATRASATGAASSLARSSTWLGALMLVGGFTALV